MEKRGSLITFIWVLSLLTLPLSNLPNRILLGLLIVWSFVKLGKGVFRIPYLKLSLGIALVLLTLSALTNDVLSKELMLGLSIPAQGLFLIIVRPGSQNFKKGFHAAVISILGVLILLKIREILQIGFSDYFDHKQWWNLWHYKNFTESLSLHPTYLSLFLLTGLSMLLLGSATPSVKNKVNRTGLTLLATYLIGLWLIASKIALIALGLLLILYYLQQLNRFSKKRAVVTALLIGGAIILPMTSPSIQHRLTHELNTAMQEFPAEIPNRLTERRALWSSAFIDMDRHPIQGTSFRGVKSREAIYAKAKFFYKPLEKPMNAHNNFIEFGLRYGILFGVLFFLSSIFGLYKACKSKSNEIVGFILVCIVLSMTESFLFREQGLALTALILLFYGLGEYERNI